MPIVPREKQFDAILNFNIESEYKEAIEEIANKQGMLKSEVCRQLIKESLYDYLDESKKESEQISLGKDLL